MSNRGQPKTSHLVKTSIVFKVKQYQKRYNESGRKAWLRLTRHRAFPELMAQHFKNKKTRAEWWVTRMNNSIDVKINFYKNHIKKWIS